MPYPATDAHFPRVRNKSLMFKETSLICHIEAAERGGQRYNPLQTDDERRHYDNLILLCANHHIVTNNVSEYPVQRLKEMKQRHELRYLNNQYTVADGVIYQALRKLSESDLQVNLNSGQGNQFNNQGTTHIGHQGPVYNCEKQETDFGIIAEIINYIFSNKISRYGHEVAKEASDLTKLAEKINLNFSVAEHATIKTMIRNVWGRMQLVKRFIETETENDPARVDALIEKIQSDYRNVNETMSIEASFKCARVIDEMANEYVPECKQANPDYLANAKAIILYFFELCYFGQRTTHEENDRPGYLF
ncbi:MAG: hypothetical protein LLF76_07070 [Planctomycetaceae bacterium]|nr:hypothetical protein [Planctomycetaceae bacterium]